MTNLKEERILFPMIRELSDIPSWWRSSRASRRCARISSQGNRSMAQDVQAAVHPDL